MTPRIILTLMVKNESRIIERCLEQALPHVDATLISDTGSTDDTIALARTRLELESKPFRIQEADWKDFGYNRSLSFTATKAFTEELGWSLERTYCLVLDADMLFKCPANDLANYLDSLPDASGISVKQINGELEYYNTRLMRLSDPWFCEGVTHEYWTGGGKNENMPSDIAWIDDKGDGGCKADKFERDELLLLSGLRDSPSCERYMFYLAQTYHCLNEPQKAMEWYEKRIEAGGWVEEIWYSHLMLARILLKSRKQFQAEEHVAQGLHLQPDRIEGLLSLITHFRETQQPFKAWHYLQLAERIQKPQDARLFLETDAYTHKPDYERTMLHYYIRPDQKGKGAILCLSYKGPQEYSVMINLPFYSQPLSVSHLTKLDFPTPPGFSSSSVAVDETGQRLCVRTVSYSIAEDGSYYLRNNLVETLNFSARWDSATRSWSDWTHLEPHPLSHARWRREDQIRGLEDVRIRGNCFTAATREYSYGPQTRIVHGTFPDLRFAPVVPPREETYCEKNWLPISDTEVIYEWHPLTIGRVKAYPAGPSRLEIILEHPTPTWFRHLRGSAPPVELEDGLWTLVHIVSPKIPRVYLHCWILLSKYTCTPLAFTHPFHFKNLGIEYCLGTTLSSDRLNFGLFFSAWDKESWYCETSIEEARKSLRFL